MTSATATLRSQLTTWHRAGRIAPAAVAALVMITVGAAAAFPGGVRIALAIPAAALLISICVQSPRRSVILLLLWLAVFGTIRRLLLADSSAAANDPLLLVAPPVVVLLVVVAARRGAFRGQTSFTKKVILFSVLVLIEAVNPLQGGIAVGAGGLLFVLVPLLWFWIGRALVDETLLLRILRLVGYLSLAAALYGLFQVYVGFPSWDQHWLDVKGFTALFINRSAIRPFASFASSSEYVGLLSIGTVLWALRLPKANRAIPATAALLVLGWALAVASVRGALIVVPVTLGVTFAAARGFGIGRIALAALVALFLLGFIVTRFDPSHVGGARTSVLLSRSVTGLSDPFDSNVSTLPVHIQALVTGLKEAWHDPVGHGVGAITIASDKFGSSNAATDIDPSNVAIAMGVPGLLLYAAIVLSALRLALREARGRRSFLTLAALAVALVTILQWLNGGNYAVAPLPWLILGFLDRQSGARAPAGSADVAATYPAAV